MSDGVCELLSETIRNMFGCYVVVEYIRELFCVAGGALLKIQCIVFQSVCVCVVPVILVCI